MAKQKRTGHKTDVKQLHGIKNSLIKRNKDLKFKNVPLGSKVALINNSKIKNKNTSPQKKFPKSIDMKNNQNSPKSNTKQSKEKQNSPKGKQNSSHSAQKKLVNKKYNLNIAKRLEKVDNSDINEEIFQKDVSLTKMDITLESEEGSSDTSVQDLFGMSLNDESDEDDEDFVEEEEDNDDDDDDDNDNDDDDDDDDDNEDEDDDHNDDDDDDDDSNTEEETKPSKHFQGLKMFQGIKPNVEVNDEDNVEEDGNFLDEDFKKISSLVMETDISDEDEDVDEDDLNEDDDDDDNDQDDDEDDNEDDDDDDDDEDDDNDDDDDDDDDDGDDDDVDVDENEDSVLGLKALLGNSIADDDDDDEDFNEEDEDDEDDDISDEDEDSEENDRAVKVMEDKTTKAFNSKYDSKENEQIEEEEESNVYAASDFTEEGDYIPDLEVNKRTIRVDNVPKETKESVIRKIFGKFGSIDTIRIRGIIPKNPKMSKKVAAITKQIHPKINTFVVYVKYKLKQSARNALSMNGKLFEGNFVNVKILHDETRRIYDNKKAVFLGNLKFGIDNNKIFKHFGQCGEIENVRLVRDQQTGITKGFGYINFKTEEGAALALQLDGKIIMNRPVRVRPCVSSETQLERRLKKEEARKRAALNTDDSVPKKLKNGLEKPVASEIENKGNVKKHKKKSSPFQGQQAGFKNKTKDISNHKMKKKEMARKLVAKPNKPAKV